MSPSVYLGVDGILKGEVIRLGAMHEKYLQAQRNLSIEDKESIITSYEKYHSTVAQFLPEKCNSVLDIGCGLGITDLCIFEHYGRDDNIMFNLLDKTEFTEKLYFGFEEVAAFYNDLEIAKKLLRDYGISEENITIFDAERDKLSELRNIDLVISSIAWGFHFPISVYVHEVVNLMHENSVLILDVRKGTGGVEELELFFDCNKILEGSKSIRIACTKRK